MLKSWIWCNNQQLRGPVDSWFDREVVGIESNHIHTQSVLTNTLICLDENCVKIKGIHMSYRNNKRLWVKSISKVSELVSNHAYMEDVILGNVYPRGGGKNQSKNGYGTGNRSLILFFVITKKVTIMSRHDFHDTIPSYLQSSKSWRQEESGNTWKWLVRFWTECRLTFAFSWLLLWFP